jgi:LysM repeat protein
LIPLDYKVRAGDTLSEIGQQFNTPVEDLVAANNLKSPDHIQVGQVLRIPPPQEEPDTAGGGKLSRQEIARFVRSLVDTNFGAVCRTFESNNDISARADASADPGGVSFGCYQISSSTMPAFVRFLGGARDDTALTEEVRSVARKAHDGLSGHPIDSEEFKDVWRDTSQVDPRDFRFLQHLFIIKSHLEPALVQANKLGLPISEEMAEIYLSVAVQHSPSGVAVILSRAAEKAPPATSSVADITRAIYDSRREYVESVRDKRIEKIQLSSDSDVEKERAVATAERYWKAVLRRLVREEAVALDVVGKSERAPNI